MQYSLLNKRSWSPYRFTQTSEVNGGEKAILNGRRLVIRYKISKRYLKITTC